MYVCSSIFNYLWGLFYCARHASGFGRFLESLYGRRERTCFANCGSGGYITPIQSTSVCLYELDASQMSSILTGV